MARPKCDFLSGGGIVFNLVKTLVDAAIVQGGTPDDVHALLTKEGADKLKRVAAILVEKPAPVVRPIPEPTIIEIDLELDDNLDFDRAKALGEYDDTNTDATAERFPIASKGRGKRLVKAKLVCFHRPLFDQENDSEVDREIGKLKIGVRGGTQAILAVGAQHKEQQRSKYIVGSAFWSRPDGNRYFLYLYSGKVERCLYLLWFFRGGQWSGHFWFVVVPQE